jgi:hypothetical protein
MMPIVAGQVCGLCGRPISGDQDQNIHWKTHPFLDRVRYWTRAPWIRIGNFSLVGDSTGIVLLDHNQTRFKERASMLIWSWIWRRPKNPVKKS